MKTILISVLLITASMVLLAQDTTLPQGNSIIHLYSNKTIKHVRLWKIDTLKVEFVKNGNLGDVLAAEVEVIEFADRYIEFDKDMRPITRMFDFIIPYYADTIKCIIQKVEEYQIVFVEPVSKRQGAIPRSLVREYVQWPDNSSHGPETGAVYLKAPLGGDQSTLPVLVDSAEIHDTIQNVHPVIQPAGRRTNNTAEESKERSEKISSDLKESDYYYKSYQLGVHDASRRSVAGLGFGNFILGLTYGAPFLSASAAYAREEYVPVPAGVDQTLYKEGFRNTLAARRVKSATAGAAVAKGVVTVMFLGLIIL